MSEYDALTRAQGREDRSWQVFNGRLRCAERDKYRRTHSHKQSGRFAGSVRFDIRWWLFISPLPNYMAVSDRNRRAIYL